MARHACRRTLPRYFAPAVATGIVAVTAATAALMSNPVPKAAASIAPGTPLFGCVWPGHGFTRLPMAGPPACPTGLTGVSWIVQGNVPAPYTPTYRRSTPPPTHSTTPPPTTAAPTSTTSTPSGGSYWALAPVGTSLPRSDSYCATHIQAMPEVIPGNVTANHTTPSGPVQWGPWATRVGNFTHVDGSFTGTTGEILEWAACKWGWDQDYAFAEAVRESGWNQAEQGDNGDSQGILQVRASRSGSPPSANNGWGGYPWTHTSTALDADAQMAYLRACYDGNTPWLGNGYHSGDAWGCIGSWFSGGWHDAGANVYIGKVQAVLAAKSWP